MRDSDWSRKNLLRSDWSGLIGASITTHSSFLWSKQCKCTSQSSFLQFRYFLILIFLSRNLQLFALLLVSFQPTPFVFTLFVLRILFQVPSTSVTINLRSNLICGVVIKGQETFTLIALLIALLRLLSSRKRRPE